MAIYNGFGFDANRLAAHSTNVHGLGLVHERRRLGNSGTGVLCRYPKGVTTIDTMYYIDKYVRHDWSSIALANIARKLDLPPKLDVDNMIVEESDDYDVTNMLIYNARDSDLHAWAARTESICEIMFMLAGTSRSTMWDAVAGNSGLMVPCKLGSTAMSMGTKLDMSGTSSSDERLFEGGFVFEPRPGCYKGAVVIDGNSLYGSIMSGLGIFIDRCSSSRSARDLCDRIGVDVEHDLENIEKGDVIKVNNNILIRDEHEYMCIMPSPPTLMSMVQDASIADRKRAKQNGDIVRNIVNKLMIVSGFGFLGSKHGIINLREDHHLLREEVLEVDGQCNGGVRVQRDLRRHRLDIRSGQREVRDRVHNCGDKGEVKDLRNIEG